MACGLALTLALLFLHFGLLLFFSRSVLSAFAKLTHSCFLSFSPSLPFVFASSHSRRPSSAPTTYGKLFQGDCSNLIKASCITAIYRRCCCEPASSSELAVLSPDLSIRSCSGSSNCSNCQDCTMNQNPWQTYRSLSDRTVQNNAMPT